jgi:hypothetical protein
MATWQADVFVNSQVGRIKTEVEAASFAGAKQQIYAKHGDVQQITNLQQVRSSSLSSSSSSSDSGGGAILLLGFIVIALIMNYWYYIVPAAIIIGLLWWFANK